MALHGLAICAIWPCMAAIDYGDDRPAEALVCFSFICALQYIDYPVVYAGRPLILKLVLPYAVLGPVASDQSSCHALAP